MPLHAPATRTIARALKKLLYRLRSPLDFLAVLGALGAAVALRIWEPTPIKDVQLRIFDGYQQLRPRPYVDAGVRIVDIDDASLERIGQWPWPRTEVARLIDRLTGLGAAVVAFDVVFAEPDRTSPSQIARLWSRRAALGPLARLFESLPEHDKVLARSMARSRVVTGFALGDRPGVRLPKVKHGIAYGGADPRALLPPYGGAVSNLSELEESASGNGSFAIEHDRDGIVRRVPLIYRLGDAIYPSLALEALRVAVGGSTYLIRSAGASGEIDFGAATGITHVRISRELTVPTDAQGRVWVHATLPTPARYVSAWQVLEGEVASERIEGNIVFVGSSAKGLGDLRATTLDPAAPGVVLHAEVIEQILLQHYLTRPDWATGAEVLFIVFWGLFLVFMIRRASALLCAATGLLGIVGAGGFSWLAFTQARLLFDPVYPSLAGLFIYMAGLLVNYRRTESERHEIRTAFGRYLAPALVEQVAARPERLRLGGEVRELSVLFADIRGFTAVSEQLAAEELTRMLNTFLTPMTEIILETRGTIDKYIGDCIMAFWNAPLDDPDHARHGCDAALAMLGALPKVNAAIRASGAAAGPGEGSLRIGIGLNTGNCCVGNMGSEQRFSYSALGDEVNLASRLEGQSKAYGVSIVLSENTSTRVPEYATLELDWIRVQGRSAAVRIHTLLGGPERRQSEAFQVLAQMHATLLAAYRDMDWDRALELCNCCGEQAPELGALYQMYRARIVEYRFDPPAPDWDRVYSAREK